MADAGEPPLLEVDRLTKRFGGFSAIEEVSFAVRRGEAVGIIGPNGAGKTTLFNLVSGLDSPTTGQARFKRTRIRPGRPHLAARAGLGRTFQTVRVFGDLSVLDNLRIGGLHGPTGRRPFDPRRAAELLDLVGLPRYEHHLAGELSYGQRKLLELAVVLMSEPELVLLDEPVAGVTPALVTRIGDLLHYLSTRGLTLVVVEHNVPFVVRHCPRVIVLSNGKMIADGPGEVIQRDPRVLDAYLGGT